MAAVRFNQELIKMVESADIPKPMCDGFKRMISGMKSVPLDSTIR